MHNRCSDSLERVSVDILHGVVYGVPIMSESAFRIGVVLNNIDAWYACKFIHVQMIVGNGSAFFV